MTQKSSSRSEALAFFSAFIKNPGSVGAILPASRYLADAMIADISLLPGEMVLELGPGTGSITQSLARDFSPAQYIGVERESQFVDILSERFPQYDFVHGLAERAVEIFREKHHGSPRAIISSLPFASLPQATQTDIIDNLDQLMGQGSVFRTYQYLNAYPLPSSYKFRRRMEQRFGLPRTRKIKLANVPPAIVFSWER